MVDMPPEPAPEKPRYEWLPLLFSWKKFREFAVDVMRLTDSVNALKEQNKKLQEEVFRIQRQVDDQAGQLRVIISWGPPLHRD